MDSYRRPGPNRMVAASLSGLLLTIVLCSCGIAGNTTTNLIVDFNDAQASTARATVRDTCGGLPGIGVVPPRSKDVSVYFDIQHATNIQVNDLDACINDLQTKDPTLGIRGYRIDDGSGN